MQKKAFIPRGSVQNQHSKQEKYALCILNDKIINRSRGNLNSDNKKQSPEWPHVITCVLF